METLVERCAGLDVHQASVTASSRGAMRHIDAVPTPHRRRIDRAAPGWRRHANRGFAA